MTDVRICDKYFKAVIIEILQWEIPSPFETNEKIEILREEITDKRKMKWEFRTEKCNTKVKNLMDRLSNGTEETAERIRELEDRIIEIAHCKQQRENRLEKVFKKFSGPLEL